MAQFSDLLGKTLKEIDGAVIGSEQITFITTEGESFRLWHNRDCCESVEVQDVCGDVEDLIGSPIVQADESTNENEQIEDGAPTMGSFTWTFYRIATARGAVVLRWLGESNGYYSESVDFERL